MKLGGTCSCKLPRFDTGQGLEKDEDCWPIRARQRMRTAGQSGPINSTAGVECCTWSMWFELQARKTRFDTRFLSS